MNDMLFEKQIDNIKFFQSHPSLKPFIGGKYTGNDAGIRILLVGESHYVKEPWKEITSKSLLNDWWSETPPQIYDICWYNTRGTIILCLVSRRALMLFLGNPVKYTINAF